MDGIYMNVVFLPTGRGKCTTPDVRCLKSGVGGGRGKCTTPDVRCLKSGVGGGRGNCTTPDVRCLNSGIPPGNPEKPRDLKHAPITTKAMEIGPHATQNHENLTLEPQEIQFLRKLIFAISWQMLVFAIPDT